MQASRLRPALRQHLLRSTSRVCSVPFRAQHGTNYGPHKEYFQNPGQTPVPDTTPYNHQPPQQQFQPPILENTGPSRIVRALRSLLWGIVFTSAGVVFGTGLITWEYIQPPFEAGSEEDQELSESVVAAIEQHPIVDALRSDGWTEEDFYTQNASKAAVTVAGARNLIHDKLTGTQGLTVKAFQNHPSKTTILVFFPGFGIEGWPDTVHGGIITSMFVEGFRRHIETYYSKYAAVSDQFLNVDFKVPVRPGDVYTILIPPAGIVHGVDQQERTKVEVVSFLMQLETAPKISSVFDPKENVDKHTIEIVSQGNTHITHAIAILKMHAESLPMVDLSKEGPDP